MTEPQQRLKKYYHDQLEDIKAALELPEELAQKVTQETVDIIILNTLIDASHYDAAIKFLSLGLPKREGIWWGYICAQQVEGKSNCLKTQQALKHAYDWVHAPSEEARLNAEVMANALDLYTPASWVNMAIYWSGGSIAPKDQPAIEPEPLMFGHALSNAIIMAAEKTEKIPETKKRFLKQGIHISMGGNGKID